MRVAAPFLPPGYREAAYLLGTAKQTGRISPVDLAIAAAPQIKSKFGQTDQRLGFFAEQFPKTNQFLFGSPSAEYELGAQKTYLLMLKKLLIEMKQLQKKQQLVFW